MDLKHLDILIFRKKNLLHSIYSIITLSLDNHMGIIIELEGKKYLNHFVITDLKKLLSNIFFKTNYSCGRAMLTPIMYIKKDEYYVYRSLEKLDYKNDINNIIKEANCDLNYISNIPLIIGFLFSRNCFSCNVNMNGLQNHTSISYVLWFLYKGQLYNPNCINNDFYKKDIDLFTGFTHNYKLIKGHNIGIKDLSNFNPYSLSYLFSFIFNMVSLPLCKVYNNNGVIIPWYTITSNVVIITIFVTLSGRHAGYLYKYNGQSRRYIGVLMMYVILSFYFWEYKLNIDKNLTIFIGYLMNCPRIAMTRFASWLCNDIKGIINKKTMRPYDVALYESLTEGVIPILFILVNPSFLTYQTKNIIIAWNYSITRFIIEFYKPNNLNQCLLNLGQIDSVLNIIIAYWYINHTYKNVYLYLLDLSLMTLFYLDTCFRFSLNKFNYSMNVANILQLDWKTSFNKGFYNGYFASNNKYKKLIFPLPMLCLCNYLFIKKNIPVYLFNCFACLNICERFLNGHVTDYLTISFYNYKTLNLNFADIIINCYIIFLFTIFLSIK